MPFQGDELYRGRDDIVASMILLMQNVIPDVWIAEDGNLRMLFEVEASQIEGLYLANQMALEDMFLQTANYSALLRWGNMLGIPQKTGVLATGQLLFTAAGGTYIPVGAEVYYDPGGGLDPLFFVTTQDGTTPSPGIPTPVTVADAAVAGNLTGTYEYVVTFVTNQGETVSGADSNAVTVAASQIALTNIPVGGVGTLSRNVYRSIAGGAYNFVANIPNNTATTYQDNIAATISQQPPTDSTAERVLLNAQAEEAGTSYNAVPGSITILSQVPDGVTGVTNPATFIGGTDTEDFEAFRSRLLTYIQSPQTGSVSDIKSWTLAIDGVDSVTVFANDNLGTPTNGHVTVRVAGPNGTQVPDTTLALVYQALQAQDLANITMHVGNFTPVQINVSVAITTTGTYTTSDVTANIQSAISDYITSVPVGGTLYTSGIVAVVVQVPGVADVLVSTPSVSQTAGPNEKFIPGTITVS